MLLFQQRRTTKEATHHSLICFHMLNCAQRFFFLLKQTEHAPSSGLLVFPFVSTHLSSDCWQTYHRIVLSQEDSELEPRPIKLPMWSIGQTMGLWSAEHHLHMLLEQNRLLEDRLNTDKVNGESLVTTSCMIRVWIRGWSRSEGARTGAWLTQGGYFWFIWHA